MRRLYILVTLFLSSVVILRADEPAVAPGVETSTVSASTFTVAQPPVELFVFPVKGSHPHIVSGFGERSLQKLAHLLPNTRLPDEEFHEGIDFAVSPGSHILAAHSGKVIFAGFSTAYVTRKSKKEKNRFVIVRRADGVSTRYVHLNRISVRSQQEIVAGDELGTASESDEWTVPVLHFEVRNAGGKAVNPLKFLPSKDSIAASAKPL